jgi:hypothetical protein
MTAFVFMWMMACGTGSSDGAMEPEQAAELADAIAADPGQADALLSAQGLDRASFDALLYDIAADPALTERYLEARD